MFYFRYRLITKEPVELSLISWTICDSDSSSSRSDTVMVNIIINYMYDYSVFIIKMWCTIYCIMVISEEKTITLNKLSWNPIILFGGPMQVSPVGHQAVSKVVAGTRRIGVINIHQDENKTSIGPHWTVSGKYLKNINEF